MRYVIPEQSRATINSQTPTHGRNMATVINNAEEWR